MTRSNIQLIVLLNLISMTESIEELGLKINASELAIKLHDLNQKTQELQLSTFNSNFFNFVELVANGVSSLSTKNEPSWSLIKGFAKSALGEIKS